MNANAKLGLLAALAIGFVAVTTASNQSAPEDLSSVQLPANSCSISCPAGTQWRGNPAPGGGVTCTAEYSPVCQCQDDSKPLARCEPIRKSK